MSRTKVLFVCTMVASLVLLAGSALAATTPPPADTLKVDYYANAGGSADANVRIINPGTSYRTMCADIFVFGAFEEIQECCSCPETPDDLRTLSVNSDLLGNPLTGSAPTTGSIKIVSAAQSSGTCPVPNGHPTLGGAVIAPTPALRVFTTHIQNNGTLTEDVSPDATLSSSEVGALQSQCYGITLDGSGKGICSCGSGS
jgi:hypothetical protein